MQFACYSRGVARPRTTDLQIRGIPVQLRELLRRRAGRKGVPMSQLVIDLLKRELELPTMEEWLAETRDLPRTEDLRSLTGADAVREGRREAGIEDDD